MNTFSASSAAQNSPAAWMTQQYNNFTIEQSRRADHVTNPEFQDDSMLNCEHISPQ